MILDRILMSAKDVNKMIVLFRCEDTNLNQLIHCNWQKMTSELTKYVIFITY